MASQNAKSTADQDGPVNLTEIAAGMSWRDACKTLSVDYRCHSSGLVIQPLDDSENGIENDGGFSTIYVVISGYSVLHCGEKEIECTDGDVLFVPRGHPHRFERMDGEIKIWRTQLFDAVSERS
jgi:mannose-6-phosphate isomerase-like protein (cupin superfamily)